MRELEGHRADPVAGDSPLAAPGTARAETGAIVWCGRRSAEGDGPGERSRRAVRVRVRVGCGSVAGAVGTAEQAGAHRDRASGSSIARSAGCPLRVEFAKRQDRRRRRTGRAGDAHRRRARVLPPPRCRRPDRFRRVVHGGRVGRRRPGGGAASRSPRDWPRSFPRGCSGCGTSTCRASPRSTRTRCRGARRNIERHYDLSNDLFALVPRRVDDVLLGAVRRRATRLERAQTRKIDRLLDALESVAARRVLEIGTGWGALAIRAAQRGAQVTTLTLSREQQRLARAADRRSRRVRPRRRRSCATTARRTAPTTRSSASR